jgi:cytochrome P450
VQETLVGDTGQPELPLSGLEAGSEIRSYLATAGKEHRRRPRDDLLTDIVHAQRSGILEEEESVGMATLLFAAGTSTTISLISNVLLARERHPDQRSFLVGDLSEVPAALEESLRWQSQLQHAFRTATEPVELHGEEIEEGSRVLLLFGAATRDERRCRDPDRFAIRREPKRHIASGEGMHHCLGAPLARVEARVAVEAFLGSFPSYEILEVGEPVDVPTHMRPLRAEAEVLPA